MEKARNSESWLEEGYHLFASEGLEGLQIERLARILQLNKSGFYHYFGDMEGYRAELIALHQKKAHDYLHELRAITCIDPDYFHLVLRYEVPVMFQMQMLRCKDNNGFYSVAESIDQKEDVILSKHWSEYLGVQDNSQAAIRYFSIVRDMFYARVSQKEFNFEFIRRLFDESRAVMRQIVEGNLKQEEGEPVS